MIPDQNLFTPFISRRSKLRAYMLLSDEDYLKTRFRGSKWTATVTDRASGLSFDVQGAPCGLTCCCAALIVRQRGARLGSVLYRKASPFLDPRSPYKQKAKGKGRK